MVVHHVPAPSTLVDPGGVPSADVVAGLDVSVLGGGDGPDPAELAAALSAPSLPAGLQVEVAGTSVRVQTQRPSTLGEIAGPLVAWWLAHRPDTILQLGTAGGELRITSRAADSAVDTVRHFIEHESDRIYPLDAADGRPARRGRSRVARGFTARVVGVAHEDGILSIGVAEDDAGTGRSLVLQGVDPTAAGADLINPANLIDPDEAPYCLMTETAATVYGGVKAIALHDGTLRLQLTRTAAKTLKVAPTLTIALDVDTSAITDLRNGVRNLFADGTRRSAPTLNLD